VRVVCDEINSSSPNESGFSLQANKAPLLSLMVKVEQNLMQSCENGLVRKVLEVGKGDGLAYHNSNPPTTRLVRLRC
jgi:hypothetical protein